MRHYSSFLVRCWLTEDAPEGNHSVLQVEHIQTGASTRAQNFAEIEPWIFEACRASKSGIEAAPEVEATARTHES